MSSATSRMMPALRRVVLAGADRTDGQLLAAFVAGRDADSFAGLVRRHGPMVLGVCRRVTGDHHTAEDAFQAVFLVLARRAAAVRPREQVGNWLYGVAYRTALKARAVLARRRSREKQVDVMPESPVATLPDVWSDLQPVIDEELARLPAKLRVPVVLCDLEGRPQRDVARHLGVPPATLATRLATARRTLAARLTKRGVTLSGGALAGLLAVHGTAGAVPPALTLGITRAAEAAAAGTLASGLVSAHAVSLSEGVMRMMMLAKLKAVAGIALTAVALAGGLGLGLVPAYAGGAGDDPTAAPAKRAAPTPPAVQPAEPPADVQEKIDTFIAARWHELTFTATEPADDGTFLRRLSLDLRGTVPTPLEMHFFVKDDDDAKRDKLIDWLLVDTDARTHTARLHGVPAERVYLARLDAGDGKPRVVVILLEAAEPEVRSLAFSPDGKMLAVELVTPNTARAPLLATRWARLNADAPYTLHRRVRVAGQPQPGAHDSLWLDVTRGHFFQDNTAATGEVAWFLSALDEPKHPQAFFWDPATGKQASWLVEVQNDPVRLWAYLAADESDADFLRRVLKDVRGTAPTALEEKYFGEDKDPGKREKLLDTLLKDPAVAKKLGDEWKKKMLAAPAGQTARALEFNYTPVIKPQSFRYYVPFEASPKTDGLTWRYEVVPKTTITNPPATPKPQVDKHEKLVAELLAAKKTDAELLEAITLAVAGRLPTDAEKKLTLGLVAKAADRKAAWLEVAKALAGDDARKAK